MAATGYTPISLYYSTTASAVPVNTNLVNGELAINITDGKLYYKDNSGVVKLLASNATSAPVTTFSAGTTGFTPSTATSGAVTLAGTLATTNGGTGLTAFTSGGAVYASSTSALTTGTLPVTAGGTGQASFTANYLLIGNGTSGIYTSNSLQYNAVALTLGLASPSAWSTGNAIETGGNGCGIWGLASGTTYLNAGYYYNAADKFAITGSYALYSQLVPSDGTFRWQSSTATGTAGANATLTEKMRLNATGQLLINGTSGTALTTIASSATYPALKVPNIVETANTVAGAPAATQTFYMNLGAVQYYTSNAANNWTVNFAMSSGTSLNTAMAVGDSMSCTMLTTQGSTAYYNSAVQIDGTSVTPKWQGGSAPTSGNASGIDSYTYVIYKTASATYTVLASLTKFA